LVPAAASHPPAAPGHLTHNEAEGGLVAPATGPAGGSSAPAMANAECRSATHTAQRAQGTKAAVPIALSRSQGAASSAVLLELLLLLLGWGWFGSFFCSKLCR